MNNVSDWLVLLDKEKALPREFRDVHYFTPEQKLIWSAFLDWVEEYGDNDQVLLAQEMRQGLRPAGRWQSTDKNEEPYIFRFLHSSDYAGGKCHTYREHMLSVVPLFIPDTLYDNLLDCWQGIFDAVAEVGFHGQRENKKCEVSLPG